MEGEERHSVIIAMTASALPEEKARCAAAGMDDYLSKPVLLPQLEKMLRKWAPQSASAPANAEIDERDKYPDLSGTLDTGRIAQLKDLSRRHSPGMFDQLVKCFLTDAPERIRQIRAAHEAGDTDALMNAAHSLTGISGNIGAPRMSMIGRELQVMASGGAIEGAPKLIARLRKEFEYVKSELESITQIPANQP